jgi:P pilus assembly chaperone PapD
MTETRFRRSALDRGERGKRELRLLPLFCAIIGLSATPLGAQLTVDQLEIFVTPSATGRVMASFVVRNGGKNPAQAIITREDWDRAENGENRFLPSGSTRNTCGALMSAFPIGFRIEPGAYQVIRLAVEKAPNLSKECWDIVFVQELPRKASTTRSGLQYILRTGVKVYVVPAGLERDASITSMTLGNVGSRLASKTKAAVSPPVEQRIAIQFSNDGQVHVTAKGRIELRRLDNSIAMQIPIAEFPTLPRAVRRLEVDVPPTIPAGNYIALALIDFGGAEIAAGQLELTLR